MLKQNCIDTIYRPEAIFPDSLTWRAWLISGMELAGRQASQAAVTLKMWRNRYQQRRKLAEMPEFILKDIGIGRNEALRESEKPFWRA